jgi:hypothetical protein
MVEVRDRMLLKTDYKGRSFDAAYVDCACRPCSNCHDCGRYERYYVDGREHTRWKTIMRCATRENGQCSEQRGEPVHILRGKRGHKCLRCGVWVDREKQAFAIVENGTS